MLDHPITDIFFDLDHTLWDFEKNSALTYEQIFREQEVTVTLPDFLEIYIPLNLQYWKMYREGRINKERLRYERLKTVFDRLNYTISDTQILLLADEYIRHLSSKTHLMPHSIEVLEYLKGKYRLHIITNGFREVQHRKLENSRLTPYFIEVIDSERAGVRKPDPKIFEMALEVAEVPAQKALMIGDSLEADIIGSRKAGLQALHFNVHNEPLHEYCPIIHHLQEIKSYL
ncbi:YjjG family noncanonical pyrimidine nucleotidase [Robiginitalea sp. IMCC44478]|uniref:YjjG family noncanonical pyrimidine nucleotidase n=1 Tax=Robiginitalea sp. IMCC44478 TaxID=3459122 RepID=UPI004042EAFC